MAGENSLQEGLAEFGVRTIAAGPGAWMLRVADPEMAILAGHQDAQALLSIFRRIRSEAPAPLVGGWKLVPVEPTEEMKWAGHHTYSQAVDHHYARDAAIDGAYRAMLAASPLPTGGGGEEQGASGSKTAVEGTKAFDPDRPHSAGRDELIEKMQRWGTVGNEQQPRHPVPSWLKVYLRHAATVMREFQIQRGLISAPPRSDTPLSEEIGGLIDGLWQGLLDKDDRTSPAEYPDMALITFEEFKNNIAIALASNGLSDGSEAVHPLAKGEARSTGTPPNAMSVTDGELVEQVARMARLETALRGLIFSVRHSGGPHNLPVSAQLVAACDVAEAALTTDQEGRADG